METQSITVEVRNETGKGAARKIRRDGAIPGVCYGPGVEPFNLVVNPDELNRVLHAPTSRNTVVTFDANGQTHTVMIWDLQRDPIKRIPTHIDFRIVLPDDVVTVEVPIRTTGRSPDQEAGAVLTPVRRTTAVRCKVRDIPGFIEYDITGLVQGDNVLASHLDPPENGEIIFKSDYVVLQLVMPRGADEDEEGDEEGEEEGAEEEVEETS